MGETMNTPLKILLYTILSILLFSPGAAFAWSCNGHVAFGVPGMEDQLLCREGYAVGYDYDRKASIWVSYHLTKESVGKKIKRLNLFKADEEIPEAYQSSATIKVQDMIGGIWLLLPQWTSLIYQFRCLFS